MILVVDDAPANIHIIMSIIGEMDEISVALDGEEALTIIKEEKPDLVLLDIVMPGIDGFEVCRRVKSDPTTIDIPIIFLSGNSSDEEKAKGLEMGAVDFLIKPIDNEKLKSIVKPYIKS